jgi:chromosome segregation ATPase
MAQKEAELRRVAEERDALAARLREASAELEAANEKTDLGGVELQRLRVENASQRDRLTTLQREKSLADDEIHALTKAGNELRDELEAKKGEHVAAKQRADELSDELSARDRQLERAHEDVQRAKHSMEEMRGQLADVQRTKDEGWKELNARITELDQLREVIKEQERILGEQKVGLMSLETAVKDGRSERDKIVREQMALKNERDELRDKVVHQQHQVEALEEEQRRLARMLSDSGSAAGSSSGGGSDELVRLGQELRELKVQLKTAESERTRLAERLEATETERKRLEAEHAKIDVDRAQALQQKSTIDAARARLEEKLAKAEAARLKAEEALGALQASVQQSKESTDRLMVEVEREKTRASELELELARTREAIVDAPKEMIEAATHPELLASTAEIAVPAEARIHELEDEIERLKGLLTSSLHEDDLPTNVKPRPAVENGANASEIRKKAEEAYSVINDALSELRTNILLAKDLVAEHGHAVPGAAGRTLEDAINVSVDRTEDAKGVLRELRRVIES